MKQICIAVLFLLWGQCKLFAQQELPPVLVHAVQCLNAKGFIQPGRATKLEFGYVVDTKSYPGQKLIYVVNYLRPEGAVGFVFSVFLSSRRHREVLDIQNNAKFRISRKGARADFTEEPLGGIWTHEHLISAIKQIEVQPRFTIELRLVSAKPEFGTCESYADKH